MTRWRDRWSFKTEEIFVPYILIPQIVTDSTALIWIGAIGENVRIVKTFLRYNLIDKPETSRSIELSQSEWRTWKTRNTLERSDQSAEVSVIHYQRVKIGPKEPLEPRQTYTIWLDVAETTVSAVTEPAKSEDYNQRADM